MSSSFEEHPALRDLRTVLLKANEAICFQDKYEERLSLDSSGFS